MAFKMSIPTVGAEKPMEHYIGIKKNDCNLNYLGRVRLGGSWFEASPWQIAHETPSPK
jgi:hypothetical protein